MKRRISLFINAMAISAIAFMLNALPVYKNRVMMRQPDGTFLWVQIHGDEHCHTITSADGKRLLQRNPQGWLVDAGAYDAKQFNKKRATASRRLTATRQATDGGTSAYPSHGKQRALAVLVQFPQTTQHPEGLPFSGDNPQALFSNMLNQPGFSEGGATGSVRDYFLASSNGVFDLTFDVYGPITLSKDLSFYGEKINGEDLNAWNMAREACEALDAEVDFKEYDRDGDGIIDNVYVFYAGPGAATGGDPTYTVWQHAADVEKLTGRRFVFDGVRLNHYACSNEYRVVQDATGNPVRQLEGIGTVCHEFSHVLGLPDLYDTSGSGITTPGEWSLMDRGCHLNDSRTPSLYTAYERTMLGWLEPKVIGDKPQTVTLRSLAENEACIIPTANKNEYFVLENRQQTGWDKYLPGHGLLIWHINYMADYWKYNQVNTINGNLGVDIVRADGTNDYNSREGDTFPGKEGVTSISDEGYPNLLTIAGERTNAPISAISEAGGVVTFDICKANVRIDKVVGLEAKEVVPTGFTACWTPITNANVAYKLSVYTKDNGQKKYVAGYNELIVENQPVEVTGLQPDTTYYFQVAAFSSTTTGEASDECVVKTPAMSFAYTYPTALAAQQVGDTEMKATWNAHEGATDYALSVYTKTKGEPDVTAVDFTGGLEVLPTGWTTNCSFTMSISGYYGKEAPSLSMTDDYARLQTPSLKGNLRSVSFWYRERSASGKSYIELSGLTPAGEWKEIDRILLEGRMTEGKVYTLDESATHFQPGMRALRIVYHRVDKGTLALDDVRVGYNDKFTRHYVQPWEKRRLNTAETCAVVTGLQPKTTYYYTVYGIDAAGTFTQASNEIEVQTTQSASIGEVVTDNAQGETEYFDLRGVKVNASQLTPGIYLRRQGTKVEKVILCR